MSETSSNSESSMSFREKSAWASLAVMFVVFVPYFIRMFRLFQWRELTAGSALGQFIGAVIFQIVLLVIVHIAIALRSPVEGKDERDRAIESKSFRNAYFVLVSSGFVLIPCVLGLGFGIDPSSLNRLLAPAFLSQLLLLCFVVAEAAKYLTLIVSYRRGS